VTDEDPQLGYAKVRDGVLEHHPKMSFAEIAVFHHLLNRANRKDTKRWGPIGLCHGLTGNRIADDMGKSREATHRALRGLETPTVSRPKYIERRHDGIFIFNFDPAGKPPGLKRSHRLENRPAGIQPAGIPPVAGWDPAQIRLESRPDPAGIQPPNRSTGDGRRETGEIFARPTAAPPDRTPAAYWDSGIGNVVLDKDWLREELREYSTSVGVVLNEEDYSRQHERLRREFLRDPRLRACIRKADGKPSTEAKFKAMASYVVSRFKEALDRKADSKKKAPSRNEERKAKTDDALRQVMLEVLEEEAIGEKV
jgi:hypothetical protein